MTAAPHDNHNHQELTKNQSLVFGALSEAEGPLSAYSILDQLRDEGFRAPLQVYRALDKLLEFGMVHRLESLNAFIGCPHPGGGHASQFLVCERCDTATEINDPAVTAAISRSAEAMGFQVDRPMVEVTGICPKCRSAGSGKDRRSA